MKENYHIKVYVKGRYREKQETISERRTKAR